jgi:hypothetical protein
VAIGLSTEFSPFDARQPDELGFQLMRLACKREPKNPFAAAKPGEVNGFIRRLGSEAFVRALQRDGARIDQNKSRRYWLYRGPLLRFENGDTETRRFPTPLRFPPCPFPRSLAM